MKITHKLTIRARCPVDAALDIYTATIVTRRMLPVEKILETVAAVLTDGPLFQEQITETLAERLDCAVTTVGYHSGVETTCES